MFSALALVGGLRFPIADLNASQLCPFSLTTDADAPNNAFPAGHFSVSA